MHSWKMTTQQFDGILGIVVNRKLRWEDCCCHLVIEGGYLWRFPRIVSQT